MHSATFTSAPSRRRATLVRAALLALGLATMVADRAGAQAPQSQLVTRQELQAKASQAARSGDADVRASAAAIEARLKDGDFRVGDKIVLRTAETYGLPSEVLAPLNDTIVVRDGRMLRLPNMSDLSLAGVLRSEFDSVLNTHVRKYLRLVELQSEILIPAVVTGPVGKPGYTAFPPDLLVSDAIMRAGGPAGNADLSRSVVKRDGEKIIGRDSLQAAIRNGATLDRIDFQSGDEIAVGEKRNWNWATVLQITGAATGLLLLVLQLTNR